MSLRMITPNESAELRRLDESDNDDGNEMPSMNKRRLGRRALLPSVEWREQAPLCEHDAKAQARLAAELLWFDEMLDEDASIRFDDAL